MGNYKKEVKKLVNKEKKHLSQRKNKLGFEFDIKNKLWYDFVSDKYFEYDKLLRESEKKINKISIKATDKKSLEKSIEYYTYIRDSIKIYMMELAPMMDKMRNDFEIHTENKEHDLLEYIVKFIRTFKYKIYEQDRHTKIINIKEIFEESKNKFEQNFIRRRFSNSAFLEKLILEFKKSKNQNKKKDKEFFADIELELFKLKEKAEEKSEKKSKEKPTDPKILEDTGEDMTYTELEEEDLSNTVVKKKRYLEQF